MSSYIVKDKTLNRFLTWLYFLPSANKSSVYRKLNDLGFALNEEIDFEILGKAMQKMNYEAVNYRYDKKNKPDGWFTFQNEQTKDVQVLKSLQCFLYQCTEGNIPKKKLYKCLKLIEDLLKNDIIEKNTDYNLMEWG